MQEQRCTVKSNQHQTQSLKIVCVSLLSGAPNTQGRGETPSFGQSVGFLHNRQTCPALGSTFPGENTHDSNSPDLSWLWERERLQPQSSWTYNTVCRQGDFWRRHLLFLYHVPIGKSVFFVLPGPIQPLSYVVIATSAHMTSKYFIILVESLVRSAPG